MRTRTSGASGAMATHTATAAGARATLGRTHRSRGIGRSPSARRARRASTMSDSRLVTETPHAARGYILAFSCIVLVYRSLGSMIALAPGAAAGVRIVLARRRGRAHALSTAAAEERRAPPPGTAAHAARHSCVLRLFLLSRCSRIRHESVTAPRGRDRRRRPSRPLRPVRCGRPTPPAAAPIADAVCLCREDVRRWCVRRSDGGARRPSRRRRRGAVPRGPCAPGWPARDRVARGAVLVGR